MKADRLKILIIDDSEINRSILADMLEDDYAILEAEDGCSGLEVMQKYRSEISLILLDIVMPRMDGFAVLEKMRELRLIEEIPVIMISAENSQEQITRAYEFGVTDFIARPFDAMIVHHRVINTIQLYSKQKQLIGMVADQMYQRERQSYLMVDILSHIVEFRNGESGRHVIHVRTLTELILRHLEETHPERYHLSDEDITRISMASTFHDIGKIGIDEKILNKPGRLTKEEFEIMKTHSMLGAQMLEQLAVHQGEPLLEAAYEICRWHHERFDGRGYPDGLAGDAIPISAQVVALADVYDALTSDRVYKKAIPHDEAVAMILDGQCGIFNPQIMDCLKELSDTLEEQLEMAVSAELGREHSWNATREILEKEKLLPSCSVWPNKKE